MFNPFETNDESNDIMGYQGDLDPDKYDFNIYWENW